MNQTYSRIALVTGATAGIGEATVRAFCAAGYAVLGTGRRAERLQALERELGAAFCGVPGDITDPALVEQLFETARSRFGAAPDIVVANAGRGLGGAVSNADMQRFEEILQLNVTATLRVLQRAAQLMVPLQAQRFPRHAADIVVIGSVVGRHISPFSAVYSATKFAVHALAESLRREIGPRGVRVSLVEPGIVVTEFQDAAGYKGELRQHFHETFGPLLTGDDIARAILFIVSQPPHVHVSDILVRPVRQDYP